VRFEATGHRHEKEPSKFDQLLGTNYRVRTKESVTAIKSPAEQSSDETPFRATEGRRMKRAPRIKQPAAHELVLEINLDAQGSFLVECLAEHIVNQAATSVELRNCIREAVESLHSGAPKPAAVRLHLALNEEVEVGS
jgi:hypothetical protein